MVSSATPTKMMTEVPPIIRLCIPVKALNAMGSKAMTARNKAPINVIFYRIF